MSYISSVRENTYTIEPGENNQGNQVTIDGAVAHIDWQKIAPLATETAEQTGQGGRYTLLIDGHSYEIFARRLDTAGESAGITYEILLAGQRFEVQVEDERERALLGSLKPTHEAGEIKVRAPMPGLVLNIAKAVGEKVARGETVAVLEAMKMENDLTTPHAGIVKEVLVSQGQTVNQGDILVVIASS